MSPQNPKQTSPSEPRQGNPGGKPQGNPNPSTSKPDEQKRGNEPTRTGGSSPQPQQRGPQSGAPQQGGSQHQRQGGMPRYDDRPESQQDREGVRREENEGSAGQTTKSPEQRAKEAQSPSSSSWGSGTSGMPRYGDRESGDPRRSDVESGQGESEGRSQQK